MIEVKKLESEQSIRQVLEQHKETLPSLQQGSDYISSMAKKFYDNGIVIVIEDETFVNGFAAFYCNDQVNKTGYLSMIAVMPDARAKGNGYLLLTEVEKTCRNKGMKILRLEVSKANSNAIFFYKRNDFGLYETRLNSFIYEKNL